MPITRLKKNYYFDVEIITDDHVYCVTKFQISHHKKYRGVDIKTLKEILRQIEESESKTTIFIRGVNY